MPGRLLFLFSDSINGIFAFTVGATAGVAASSLTPELFMQVFSLAISIAAIFVTVGIYVATVRGHDKEIERHRSKLEVIEATQAGRSERLTAFDSTLSSLQAKQYGLEKMMSRTSTIAAELAKSLAVIESLCNERCKVIVDASKTFEETHKRAINELRGLKRGE